jgi:hypothetical protein
MSKFQRFWALINTVEDGVRQERGEASLATPSSQCSPGSDEARAQESRDRSPRALRRKRSSASIRRTNDNAEGD